jgi:hypothetical protein
MSNELRLPDRLVSMPLANASSLRARKALVHLLASTAAGSIWFLITGMMNVPQLSGWLNLVLGLLLLVCLIGIWNTQEWACIACGMLLTFLCGYRASAASQGDPRSWFLIVCGLTLAHTYLTSSRRLGSARDTILTASPSSHNDMR